MDYNELSKVLFTLCLILMFSHLFGFVFEKCRMPRVMGEIFAGILLGPSILGYFWGAEGSVVDSILLLDHDIVQFFYSIGLVLLMFCAGFKISNSNWTRPEARVVLILFAAGTILPFTAGFSTALVYDLSDYMGPNGSMLTMAMVLAIAVSVTSIPVISKIFLDLGIVETRFARIVLAASTVQDILLWALLATVTQIAQFTSPSLADIGRAALLSLAFCAGGLLLGPQILRLPIRFQMAPLIRSQPLGYAMVWCLAVAALASWIGVGAVFGGFIAGIAFGSINSPVLEPQKSSIYSFSMGFFVPISFALVGCRIAIPAAFDPMLFLGFLVMSSALEMISVYGGMYLAKFTKLTALNFAVAMNTRGGPGIVLASVVYDHGIVDQRVYVTLVLAAVSTSLMSGVWFDAVTRRGAPLYARR